MRGYLLGVGLGIAAVALAAIAIATALAGTRPVETSPGVIHATPRTSGGSGGGGGATDAPATPDTAPEPTTSSTGRGPSGTPPPTENGQTGLRVGERAPRLDLPLLGGGRIGSARLAGRPVWINFTASWCPTCRDELRLMERAGSQLGDDLRIVVIDVREDERTVRALVDSLRLDLPVALDEDGRAAQAWGALVLPVHYWLDADGIVRSFTFGGGGPDEFLRGIRTVIPDASFEP